MMTPFTVFVLLLLVGGVVLFLVQAFGATLGRVAPGWLGAALVTLAVLLSDLPG